MVNQTTVKKFDTQGFPGGMGLSFCTHQIVTKFSLKMAGGPWKPRLTRKYLWVFRPTG